MRTEPLRNLEAVRQQQMKLRTEKITHVLAVVMAFTGVFIFFFKLLFF